MFNRTSGNQRVSVPKGTHGWSSRLQTGLPRPFLGPFTVVAGQALQFFSDDPKLLHKTALQFGITLPPSQLNEVELLLQMVNTGLYVWSDLLGHT